MKSGLTLDTRDFEYVQDIRNKTGDNYTKVEIPFNSMMKEFFEGSNIEELIQRMFAHIRRQVENPCIYEISFILDQIMHLHINFYKLALALTGGRYYAELVDSKKQCSNNPKDSNEECFKWAVIAALYHEDI